MLTIIFPQTAEGKCTVSVLDQRQWGGCIDVEIPPQTTTPTPPTTTLPPINGFPQLCPAAACGVTDQLECRRPFPLNVCASILTVPGGKKCPNNYTMCTCCTAITACAATCAAHFIALPGLCCGSAALAGARGNVFLHGACVHAVCCSDCLHGFSNGTHTSLCV